jgi:hypothetical protein
MLLARKTLRAAFSAGPPLSASFWRPRYLSSRASAVLSAALDIPTTTTPIELPGVYDGEWKGTGDTFQSVCPTTGEVLAHVKSVNINSKYFLVFPRFTLLLSSKFGDVHCRLRRWNFMRRWRRLEWPTSISGVCLRPVEGR